MEFETQNNELIFLRRMIASAIDTLISFCSGLLGGYFGAMLAALMVILNDVSPITTQRAIWSGMGLGFVFWGIGASLINKVLIQGISRASIGKKYMNLEIVSIGAPITWNLMFKRWLSAAFTSEIKVISSLSSSHVAPVYSIEFKSDANSKSDKKAA